MYPSDKRTGPGHTAIKDTQTWPYGIWPRHTLSSVLCMHSRSEIFWTFRQHAARYAGIIFVIRSSRVACVNAPCRAEPTQASPSGIAAIQGSNCRSDTLAPGLSIGSTCSCAMRIGRDCESLLPNAPSESLLSKVQPPLPMRGRQRGLSHA
jgi:hypothetical protein